MKYKDIFHLLKDIFDKNNITPVLIGGLAISKYSAARQTVDIDFLIIEEDYKKVLQLLVEEGYHEHGKSDVCAKVITDGSYIFDIDFVFVDKETIVKIINDGVERNLSGLSFLIPSLENMVALKLHAIKNNPNKREFKDLPDIINMIRENDVDISSEKFRNLCLKYGNEMIYKKILEYKK